MAASAGEESDTPEGGDSEAELEMSSERAPQTRGEPSSRGAEGRREAPAPAKPRERSALDYLQVYGEDEDEERERSEDEAEAGDKDEVVEVMPAPLPVSSSSSSSSSSVPRPAISKPSYQEMLDELDAAEQEAVKGPRLLYPELYDEPTEMPKRQRRRADAEGGVIPEAGESSSEGEGGYTDEEDLGALPIRVERLAESTERAIERVGAAVSAAASKSKAAISGAAKTGRKFVRHSAVRTLEAIDPFMRAGATAATTAAAYVGGLATAARKFATGDEEAMIAANRTPVEKRDLLEYRPGGFGLLYRDPKTGLVANVTDDRHTYTPLVIGSNRHLYAMRCEANYWNPMVVMLDRATGALLAESIDPRPCYFIPPQLGGVAVSDFYIVYVTRSASPGAGEGSQLTINVQQTSALTTRRPFRTILSGAIYDADVGVKLAMSPGGFVRCFTNCHAYDEGSRPMPRGDREAHLSRASPRIYNVMLADTHDRLRIGDVNADEIVHPYSITALCFNGRKVLLQALLMDKRRDAATSHVTQVAYYIMGDDGRAFRVEFPFFATKKDPVWDELPPAVANTATVGTCMFSNRFCITTTGGHPYYQRLDDIFEIAWLKEKQAPFPDRGAISNGRDWPRFHLSTDGAALIMVDAATIGSKPTVSVFTTYDLRGYEPRVLETFEGPYDPSFPSWKVVCDAMP